MEIIRAPGPPVYQLSSAGVFSRLSARQQLYAHHMSRAAWHGSRIVMRQVSPEANDIFDFIIDLHRACHGQWKKLTNEGLLTPQELASFLEFAGHFLYNLGNYWGLGDQKFIPDLSADALRKLSTVAPTTQERIESIVDSLTTGPPFSLGYPGDKNQSNYYPGQLKVTREEISLVSKILEANHIGTENTRIRKHTESGESFLEVLQASVNQSPVKQLASTDSPLPVYVRTGDHAEELAKICDCLSKAREYTENETQQTVIDCYIRSFQSGDMEAFRDAQKAWVADKAPVVECILGFVETYRDPHGARAEWEGFVGISDPVESLKMRKFVEQSTTFLRLLPWATPGINNGKGPFEKDTFVVPDYTNCHSMAYCTSDCFDATNIPNYNDIRETCGFKNLVIANRMQAANNTERPCHYVEESEAKAYGDGVQITKFITTATHELLGHGSGKLLREISPGEYNFDVKNPPLNPLTQEAVTSWYRPGQTWASIFGTIATSVEECRATLISLYLMDDMELLSIFGYDETTHVRADELYYYTYMMLAVEGLQALAYYNPEEKTWGQAHRKGHWAILAHLLADGGDVITVHHDPQVGSLTVKVDRTKLLSHGKPSLSRLLCRIHVWRCTADVEACTRFYEEVTSVTGEHDEWRRLVLSKPEPRWKFVHPNTFLEAEGVLMKDYDATNEGLILSWVERDI